MGHNPVSLNAIDMIRGLLIICLLLVSSGCSDKNHYTVNTSVTAQPDTPVETSSVPVPEISTNSPPRIVSMRFIPPHPKKGDRITAEVEAEDPDGDEVTLEYEWSVNGSVIEEFNGETLNVPLKKGDIVTVKITPIDQLSAGETLTNMIRVENSYPEVEKSLIDVKIQDSICYAKVSANDPDGDELSYVLLKAPQGMDIDPATGILSWKMEGMTSPVNEISISVTDTDGAETRLNLKTGICKHRGNT